MSLFDELRALLADLRRQKRTQFNRHVAIGDLLSERTDIPREYGWGEGTTCYNNVLILGEVRVGRHCWIGPNVILDGSGGPLVIGDHVDVSAGVQIYTHHTVHRAVSGGKAAVSMAPTRIGSQVYIGPNTIIQCGVTIGDRVVIGAMSLVDRDLPSDVRAWGIPARIKGAELPS
jgi:acetyltransferase-like isoleucine patch superfamily enzyme